MKKNILTIIIMFSFCLMNAQSKKTATKKSTTAAKIINGYDFFDSTESFVGKRVSLIVSYPSTKNDLVIHQKESIEKSGQRYYDNFCQCLKLKNQYSKPEKEWVNWKTFTEYDSQQNFTVNIPNYFFDNNLISSGYGNGFLLITIDVYKGEERGGNEKGIYSENPNIINYELVSIKRYK